MFKVYSNPSLSFEKTIKKRDALIYEKDFTLPENVAKEDAIAFLEKYKTVYSPDDDKQVWFNKIKEIAPKIGFAAETKEFKANPDNFKGHAGDLSTVLRIAVTGRRNTPDLYAIMSLLGEEKVKARLTDALDSYRA